ncbi:hypothetical protein SCG7086_CP_00010 [Chlamydiales bacterium SCGC AG-110-P3]|nr:hypothetical protein SCG7086_CP_00010 [Chlamydiales bacterium SCGC AG-110-P3]
MTIQSTTVEQRQKNDSWSLVEKAAILLFLGNLLMRVIIAATLPITYKEAYFWEWSLFPSLGYLDHPPMIAWMIHLATMPFEQISVWIVRAVPIVLGSASLGLLYRLSCRMFNREVGARAVILAMCTPVLTATWLLALPDTALLFFQLLAFNIVADITMDNRPFRWIALGIVIGFALLSKLVIILSLAAALVFVMASRGGGIRVRDIATTTATALVVSGPYWWWNMTTRWRALELQAWERHFYDFGFSFGKFFEVWFEQVAAASPLLLPLFVWTLFVGHRHLPDHWRAPYRMLRLQAVIAGGVVIVAGSFISQTHPHWTILAYPPAAILLAVAWSTCPEHWMIQRIPVAIKSLVVIGAISVIVVGAIPQVVVHVKPEMLTPQLGRGLVKGKQRLLGYGEVKDAVEQILEEQLLDIDTQIFTDSYHFGAPLAFALQRGPVICLDAYGSRSPLMGHAQRLYLPRQTITGTGGLYIARGDRSEVEAHLQSLFGEVEPLPPIKQVFAGETVAQYCVFRVTDFFP